ncbi:urease accessory protein UreD [Halomonas sp. PR-M31]|uniref:urease accessory protein UreD n=1 Tax=Halomonas sp. PR-M31 TaxID=1471202 RepID=UPI000A440B34|nr:urease accessory protein UreD [Halomonas sp. PR-M31]
MTSFSSTEMLDEWQAGAEMAGFASTVPQLGIGQSGKNGMLKATFELHKQITRLTQAYARPPMYANGALYLDEQLPGMAFLYLMSGSDALVQGDRLATLVTVKEGAQLHVTNTSATKIHGMRHDYAVQRTELALESGAFVEWLPEPLIPHPGARLWQHTQLDVHPEATLIFGDVLSAGRLARGERFEFEIISSQLRARRESRTLFDDNLVLQPSRQRVDGAGLFGNFSVQGSLYVLTRQMPPAVLADALHEAAQQPEVLAGASVLPGEAGVLVRILGPRTAAVQQAMTAAWRHARQELMGVGLPDTRKY